MEDPDLLGCRRSPSLGAVARQRVRSASRRIASLAYAHAVTAHPEVFDAALTLPETDRAELAHRLLISLDEPADDPSRVDAEWTSEVARREADIESGATRGITWNEVRGQLDR
jgi:putative addiction module component (TIGR02574 family)